MKSSIKGFFVILVIVMSLVAVQSVSAEIVSETITVTGTIVRIGTGPIDVDVNEVGISTFYHIPFTSLEAANIFLAVGDSLTISAYVVTFPNGETKNIAHSITVGDATYDWHPNVPKAGTTDLYSSSAVSEDCVCNEACYCYNCPKDCPDCPCDCLCECICAGDGPNGPNGPKN